MSRSSADASLARGNSHAARLWRQLRTRRVPQIVGLYLGAAWTLLQFVQWSVSRYLLSPHLVDLTLGLLLIVVPSVLLLAYERGAPGSDGDWTFRERVGVPCNLAGGLLMLALLFGGKDLGSIQKTVSATTPDGQEVERRVPKETFRKRVVLFPFDNETEATSNDWMSFGVPDLLQTDLWQDLFLSVGHPASFAERMREAGFEPDQSLPRPLKFEIAAENDYRFFAEGSVSIVAASEDEEHAARDDTLRLATRLYRVEDRERVADHSFRGSSLPDLVDEATRQLKRDLELPAKHLEDVEDRPVGEMAATSHAALRAYEQAGYAVNVTGDYAAADSLFRRATEVDPTFAMAHLVHGIVLARTQQHARARRALRKAAQHEYRLPERLRFSLRASLLQLDRKPDEVIDVARQWTTLYPSDAQAFQTLATFLKFKGQRTEAIEALRRVVEIDPGTAAARLQIGDLLRREQRYEDALQTYRDYAERYPQKSDGYRHVGLTYGQMGRLEDKLSAYKKALAAAPDDAGMTATLGYAYQQLGRFAEARKHFDAAREGSRTPSDRAKAQYRLADYLWMRGQHERARAAFDSLWTLERQYKPPVQVLFRQLARSATRYAADGHAAWAHELISQATRRPIDSDDVYSMNASFFLIEPYAELGRIGAADTLIARTERLAPAYGLDLESINWNLEQARVRDRGGDLQEAARLYRAHLETHPADDEAWRALGTVTQRLGHADEAEDHFRKSLTYYPAEPRTHLALGRLLLGDGRREEARKHLDRALRAWSKSDTTYAPAREARQLRASLTGA